MIGDCRIESKYGSDLATTPGFQITDRIETILNVNPMNVKAGENMAVRGTAVKANSQNLEGFLELNVEGTDIKLTRSVSEGKIETNFSFPENLKSGNYELTAKVYDKSGEEIGNQDTKTITISLRQEPSKIEIVIDKQSIKPGEGIMLRPLIYDKANYETQGDVKIEVKDSLDDSYFNKLVKTGEEVIVNFTTNASAGYWKIEASSMGLKSKRLFYIEELEKAQFEVVNDTLIITNIGNVRYRKAVQIAIENEVEIKEMDLEVGDSKKFRLLAPDGSYKVSVTDGSETITLSDIGLTGNVIGVEDVRNQLSLWSKYPMVWLFLIIVLGLFILMMVERVTKRNFYGYKDEKKTDKIKPVKASDKFAGFEAVKDAGEAEHSLVINGKKEEASILAIKIKNPGAIKNKIVQENVNKAIEMINKQKGSLYRTGDNFVGVFTPSLTKTFKNDLVAVKVAGAIASHLNEHNKKFKEKIDFGIGIHSGEIAAKLEQGKLKFTALGNTLSLAKKIADSARNDVLLSKETGSKVSNEVKTDKQGDYYSIKRVLDREQHKDFINNFLKRNS